MAGCGKGGPGRFFFFIPPPPRPPAPQPPCTEGVSSGAVRGEGPRPPPGTRRDFSLPFCCGHGAWSCPVSPDTRVSAGHSPVPSCLSCALCLCGRTHGHLSGRGLRLTRTSFFVNARGQALGLLLQHSFLLGTVGKERLGWESRLRETVSQSSSVEHPLLTLFEKENTQTLFWVP